MGVSGVGKSTLLALLSGWITPQEGEIWVNHCPLHQLSASERAQWRAHHLGWQGELTPLCDALTAKENLDFNAWIGLSDHVDAERSLEALRLLSLTPTTLSRLPYQLSQGERQRIEVARVMLTPRPLRVFDEPTAHLDVHAASQVSDWLTESSDDSTLIVATHDATLAQRCHRHFRLVHATGGDESLREEITCEEITCDHVTDIQPSGQELTRSRSLERPLVWLRFRRRLEFMLRLLRSEWPLYTFIILAAVIALSIPLSTERLGRGAQEALHTRAEETPLVVGALVSPLDLFFSSLYFSVAPRASLTMKIAEELSQNPLADITPLLHGGRARDLALIATDSSYLTHRRIIMTSGHAPLSLGEAIIHRQQAHELQISIGSLISTDLDDLYQLTAPPPIQLKIVGYFEAPSAADRDVIFTNLATGWAARGLAHDHRNREGQIGAQEPLAQRLTPERYHLHHAPLDLPLSALLLFPHSPRAQSLLKARLQLRDQLTVIEPEKLSSKTLRSAQQLQRLIRPLITTLSLLTTLLLIFILTQHHIKRAKLRQLLSAVGLTQSQIVWIWISEYSTLSLMTALIVLAALMGWDQWIAPDELWRLISGP